MKSNVLSRPLLLAAACVSYSSASYADEADGPQIVVTGSRGAEPAPPIAATRVTADAAKIAATVNAVSVEDTLKYFPSLVIRKRHIGDNFAPVATRTSGLGASARSLIFADGVLLSALIGNNNGNGSPRWTMVTPAEVQSIDVLYGPFSAAYAGNSIGTTVNIVTRMPDRLEARASALVNVQQFDLYQTHQTLPTWQVTGSLGNRIGNLAVLLSATRTDARSQPISFTTFSGLAQPTGTSGGVASTSRTNADLRVLGAGGIEHHIQATYKAKAVWDVTPSLKLAYVLGVWTDDTAGDVQSYEQGPGGTASYATANSGATTGFNSGLYLRDALHFSHALSLSGKSERLDWQVIGTLYSYHRDWQLNPSPDTSSATAGNGFIATRNDLPAAFAGGVGTIQKQDGTGWVTLDARANLHLGDAHLLSVGAHADRETLKAETYTIADWRNAGSAIGQLRSRSQGRTRTVAVWAQDAIRLTPALTVTLGGRQEWWRAWSGANTTRSATIDGTIPQPERTFSGFSPKASVEWRMGEGFSARLSAGQAWRMPTVGELYQTISNGSLFYKPNETLRPERARSLELALEKRDGNGIYRVSLFNEVVRNAMISQTGTVLQPDGTPFSTTFVQNVEQTRARGVELAVDRRNLLPTIDLSASLTYADAITSKNPAFPASVGKLLPTVPHWKGNAVLSWRPTPQVTLTSAVRFTSRMYAQLDNLDTIGQVYQGFYKYVVVDLRAQFRPSENFTFALGVDNVNNDRYFLFHPFPQRSLFASVDWKL
jgi:iron complex outermembrane receptor protein